MYLYVHFIIVTLRFRHISEGVLDRGANLRSRLVGWHVIDREIVLGVGSFFRGGV